MAALGERPSCWMLETHASGLQGCVIRTSHNSLYYDFLRIRRGITPDTLMPASALGGAKDKGGNPQPPEPGLDHSRDSTTPGSSKKRQWASKHTSAHRGAGPAGSEREGKPGLAGNSRGPDKADDPATDQQPLTFAQYYRQWLTHVLVVISCQTGNSWRVPEALGLGLRGSVHRMRWKIQSLQPSDYMLECTSKAVQRRAESAKGISS